LIKLFHVGNLAYIPLHNGHYVIPRPCLAPLWIFAPQHFGVAANQHGMYQILADHRTRGFAQFAIERGS
jgi:hypothetical protein